jgi:long-subunit acyl-CoA synthetase (AMP-forming)
MASQVTMAFLGLCALGLISGPVAAEETQQQMKMQVCNDEASALQLSADERKHFMADCLSKESGSTQQVRMKSCNAQAQAKALKGEERKAFMRDCLSAK